MSSNMQHVRYFCYSSYSNYDGDDDDNVYETNVYGSKQRPEQGRCDCIADMPCPLSLGYRHHLVVVETPPCTIGKGKGARRIERAWF